MKGFIGTLFVLITVIGTPSQAVTVPQKLLDRANQAFIEVASLREENARLKEAIDARDVLIAKQDTLIEALTSESAAKTVLINEKNREIARQTELIQTLEERDKIRLAEIEALRKLKCDKTIYLFGAIKTVRCR